MPDGSLSTLAYDALFDGRCDDAVVLRVGRSQPRRSPGFGLVARSLREWPALMAAEVVHDGNVAGRKDRDETT
jgi:hypothetical protein